VRFLLLALGQAEGPGLILFRGGDFGEQEAIGRLRKAVEMIANEELPRSVVVIERGGFAGELFLLG
jgi:hypothetical protein